MGFKPQRYSLPSYNNRHVAGVGRWTYSIIKAWLNASNISTQTSCNIVGHNMLYTFGHPVAICLMMLDRI